MESLFILFYFASLWGDARTGRTLVVWLVLLAACCLSLHNQRQVPLAAAGVEISLCHWPF